MKKLLSFVLAGTMLVSCTDYDGRFDNLNAALEQLEAENAALEAQILGMQAASASAAQATAAKLADFQQAVGGIVSALTTLGQASEATIQQVAIIIARIAALAEAVETNAITAAGIAEEIAAIQALLDTINENVLHHSGGGSTAGTGSEHHSGGGSSDDTTSEATGTDYLPVYTGVFGGAVYGEGGVFTFPTTAESWGGFANDNADIYPLTFSNGGTITFTASSAGADVGVKFKFEANPFPNTTPEFYTEVVTVSGATATEYSVTIPSQGTNTFNSALLYLTVQGVAVTITDIVINAAD